MVSRTTFSPVMTAASDRVVGIPSAAIVFAQHRAERGAAIAAARKRRRARALELDVAADTVGVDHLAEQDGAAVTKLGNEVAELVPGIGHRDRVGAVRNPLAGQNLDTLRASKQFRIEAEMERQRPV